MDRKVYILRTIYENQKDGISSGKLTQRELAASAGISLGKCNRLLSECREIGLIKEDRGSGYSITEKGLSYLEPFKVEKAVILAAGFGSRFVPLTYETPKGLLEVFGEPMIERQIKQLHAAGIRDITIMVGYLKEKFDYLTDLYGVKLIYNPEYAVRNTISTVFYAADEFLGHNTYILNSDNWIRNEIYHLYEPAAWYCAQHAEGSCSEWVLETDGKGRITDTYPGGMDCDYMYGPAYFSREFSESFIPVLKYYHEMPGTEQYYWEHVLMEMLEGRARKRVTAYFGRIRGSEGWKDITMYINLLPNDTVYEFENLEELRQFDPRYQNDSGSEAMQLVSRVFSVPESEIVRIKRLKAGMTNNSWLFSVKGEDYICRIPGEGTDKLINRHQEKAVYDAVGDLGISEELIYLDEDTGYKISRYYKGSRNADPSNEADMRYCMKKLRSLHESGAKVGHVFDIRERISFYEMLCAQSSGVPAFEVIPSDGNSGRVPTDEELSRAIPFSDYAEVRKKKDRLCGYIEGLGREMKLCHIDSVPDNFIMLPGADLSETERDPDRIKLIDWEYAGMCDPLMDIGMCAIYSYMDEAAAERLMEYYLGRRPEAMERRLVYGYMALGGLLWALWGVYKENLGVQFTDYTLKMYRYFKDYYKKIEKDI